MDPTFFVLGGLACAFASACLVAFGIRLIQRNQNLGGIVAIFAAIIVLIFAVPLFMEGLESWRWMRMRPINTSSERAVWHAQPLTHWCHNNEILSFPSEMQYEILRACAATHRSNPLI